VRLAEIYALFNQGREANARADLQAAAEAFDRVLARDPEFEHSSELATFYARLAEQRAETDLPGAILALRRTERLSSDAAERDRAASLRHTLEARTLFERGIVDEVLMRRAAELDPNNARLAALESDVVSATRSTRSTWARYAGAIGVAALAVLGLAVVLLRHRRSQKPEPEA
jgi:tetratricopeptide (TPR) repeat protein